MTALWLFLAAWLVVSVVVLAWASVEVRAAGKTPTLPEFLVRHRAAALRRRWQAAGGS